jgi:hypothetical protein
LTARILNSVEYCHVLRGFVYFAITTSRYVI